MERRVFSKEFKVAAVNRIIEKKDGSKPEKVQDVAKGLMLSPVLLYRWRQELAGSGVRKAKQKQKPGMVVNYIAPGVKAKEVQHLQEQNLRMRKALEVLLSM